MVPPAGMDTIVLPEIGEKSREFSVRFVVPNLV